MNIIRRDGTQIEFNSYRIFNAISKAFEACNYSVSNNTIQEIVDEVQVWDNIHIEDIQDQVEELLNAYGYDDVASEYKLYRRERAIIRKQKDELLKQVSQKLEGNNIENQNANVDEASFGGRSGEASRVMSKTLALKYCMSNMARNNHENNEIYIHDLDSYTVGMHNCCVRSTKFLTRDFGVKSFEDFSENDSVVVLSHDGSFNNAVVKKFGLQKVNKITFSLAGQRFVTEQFTANHRWILQDGTETTQLKIGDKLYKAPINIRTFNWDSASSSAKYYWCLGFVLGDGTEAYRWSHGVKNENIKFVRLRLCGDKTKYESRFSELKHSTKELENGDLYLTFSSTINFRKVFPDVLKMSRDEKLALFDGLYCADGQHSGSSKSILTSNEQIASFIEDEVPALGYYILNIKDKTGEKTNYATRGFTREYTFIGDTNKYYWTVVDIEEASEEEVWCLQVENTHSFILPNGITTGNCLTLPFDELLAKGFNTRQTDVRPANSINTAFQLVAVLFQLQSLQQFGGVAAGHLDWTMVPYVRKSFTKHLGDGLIYIEKKSEYKIKRFHKWLKNDKSHPDGTIHFDDNEFKDLHPEVWEYAMDMTQRELNQAVEGMYHNLNTLQSRSGNQLPFTSINYGTCTEPEGRMVIRALLEGSIKGVGKFHKTPIFPCGIFQLGDGINKKPEDPNYDLFLLALKSTSQRLYPNYANIDWSGNVGYDKDDPRTYFATMGK